MFPGNEKGRRNGRVTAQKGLLIPMYSAHPSEEMALIQVPNYSNVAQSTSIGVSISSQD